MTAKKERKIKPLADKIFRAKCLEVEADEYDVQTDEAKKVIVLDWMRPYSKNYAKADVRMINAVIGKFASFLADQKQSNLLMKELKTPIVEKFRDKLQNESEGKEAKVIISCSARRKARRNLFSICPRPTVAIKAWML